MGLSPFFGNLGLLLAGLIILILIGSRARKNHSRLGALSVALFMLALALVAVGLMAFVSGPLSGTPIRALARSSSADASETSTPSTTPQFTLVPYSSPTPLPSLTPTESETPIILYTPIIYVSTYTVGTPTRCTVIAKTMLNLRGDPSDRIAAIGTVFAGSLLNVTGRTANKQWWRVINTDGNVSVEGWVRADYVTADPACADDVVSPIDGTETPTPAFNKANAVTPEPCTLLTTASASLRPDPSRLHAPLALIPEKTTLAPIGRTGDGQWWHVSYGNQDGWVGSGAVIAATGCLSIPTITPTATVQ